MGRSNRLGLAVGGLGMFILLAFDGFFVYRAVPTIEQRLWPPLLDLVVRLPPWLHVVGFALGSSLVVLGGLLRLLPTGPDERG